MSNIYRLKQSMFNLCFPFLDGSIIYNTLFGTLVFADKELTNLISNTPYIDIDRLDENTKTCLYKLAKIGILREANEDELRIVSYSLNKLRYNNQNIGFTILTTRDCNFACTYCYEGTKKDSLSMTDNIVRSTLKFIKDMVNVNNSKKLDITFYGGEPLLNLRAIRAICEDLENYSSETGIKLYFSIITNGFLMRKSITDELLRYPFSFVQVTVDGPKEVHDKRRPLKNGKGTFDEIMGNLTNYVDKVRTCIRMNIDKDNIDEVRNFLVFLADSWLSNKVNVSFGQTTCNPRCRHWEDKCFDDITFSEKYLRLLYEADKLGLESEEISATRCGFFFGEGCVIDANGNLFKCWDFVGLDELSVGSIYRGFNSNFYDWMHRNPLDFDKCSKCVFLPHCFGGCAAKAYNSERTIHIEHCDHKYRIYQELVQRYVLKKHGYKFGFTSSNLTDYL